MEQEWYGEEVEDLGPWCTVVQSPTCTTIHGHTEGGHPFVKWENNEGENGGKKTSYSFGDDEMRQ